MDGLTGGRIFRPPRCCRDGPARYPRHYARGCIAKLRVAFMNHEGSDWSDLAISNTADPKFVEGLGMSGMYERMAWSAIEDLARIAGVGLAEQGA